MIIDAIKAINSNAEATVYGNDIDTCTINWNDGTTPISKEDIQAKMTELDDAESTKKASGKQKLKDLGLDDDEINALMGV